MKKPAGNLSVQRRHLLGTVYRQLFLILLIMIVIIWAVLDRNVVVILMAFATSLVMGLTSRYVYRCPSCRQSLWASFKNQIPDYGSKTPFQLAIMDKLKQQAPLRCEHCGKFIDHVHEWSG